MKKLQKRLTAKEWRESSFAEIREKYSYDYPLYVFNSVSQQNGSATVVLKKMTANAA